MKIKQKAVKNNMYQVKKKERKTTVVNIPHKWISITSFLMKETINQEGHAL